MSGLSVDDFRRRFPDAGEPPTHRVRAPGRLSILGEHIDYSGYGVFAFAISQAIHALCRPNASRVLRIRHKHPDTFPDAEHQLQPDLGIDQSQLKWSSYVLCGIKGIQLHFSESEKDLVGMDILVTGDVPQSAGLSSSSALVCGSALAFLSVNKLTLPLEQVADICAASERFVGTQGGGLDQATCLLSREGQALSIEFNPLKCESVTLPAGAQFVVMNCLLDKWKAASPEYNTRVVECRLAAKMIAKLKGLDVDSISTLGDLQKCLAKPLSDMAQIVEECLSVEDYSRKSIEEFLGRSEWSTITASHNFPEGVTRFKLRQRALHVYRESERTDACKRVCAESAADSLQRIGVLMRECQESCRVLFECSCPELDQLCDLACASGGALGAQLCGAGWGGCAVALVPAHALPTFLHTIKEQYYLADEYRRSRYTENTMFVTQPGQGATVQPL